MERACLPSSSFLHRNLTFIFPWPRCGEETGRVGEPLEDDQIKKIQEVTSLHMEHCDVESRCTLEVKEDSLKGMKLCIHQRGYGEYGSWGTILNAWVSNELAGNVD